MKEHGALAPCHSIGTGMDNYGDGIWAAKGVRGGDLDGEG